MTPRGILLASCAVVAVSSSALSQPKVPLCPGLTVVTAISQPEGDYESIKTITGVDAAGIHVTYSNEQPPEQVGGGFRIRKINTSRVVRTADLANAKLYEETFGYNVPLEVPGTTALGASRAVLYALKTKGEAELGMFDLPSAALPSASKLLTDSRQHPNIFDYSENYKLRRVESSPVMVSLIVNDAKALLPAIHATGRSEDYSYKAEFFFLDDESNPLALKWRLGIGAAAGAKAGGDRNTLQIVKISYRCNAESLVQRLERALAETGHADVYDIYFDFNSDEIREESEPTLRDIAEIMRRHPDWKLSIAGHTDAIGGDASNLDLSKRRAASVKTSLASRFGVNAGRLTTTGYGKSRPLDTNDTEEGRARNRRVELVRQ